MSQAIVIDNKLCGLQARDGAQAATSDDNHGNGGASFGRRAGAVWEALHRRAGGRLHHPARAFIVAVLLSGYGSIGPGDSNANLPTGVGGLLYP